MIVKRIKAKNYRTLEDTDIRFEHYYTAICGKNNSGKSNIIRIIQNVFSITELPFLIDFGSISIRNEINRSKDFTAWKLKEKENVEIGVSFEIDPIEDIGIYKFIQELILKKEKSELDEFEDVKSILEIKFILKPDSNKRETLINFNNQEITDSYQKDEIIRKLRSSSCSIYHNSTKHSGNEFPFRKGYDTLYEFITEEDKEQIEKKKLALVNSLKSKLKKQQKEFASFLGRLEDKYDVGLSVSEPNLERSSINISLKEKGVDVDLDDWGSGTRNRTLIFLKLLNAKKVKESELDSDKTTPFVIIEEPESFLHPSAQAEFGRILQDIAEEFQIQVIVTTHSPYLLNHKQAKSNILLDRKIERNKKLATQIVDTSGEKWYEPFALTLGIEGSDFGPLKDFIFSGADSIILVEGETDKEYLELLQKSKHGENRLNFKGEIFAYGGADNLKNNVILRFIKGRFSKFLITVDIDRFKDVKNAFKSVGLIEGDTYLQIGKKEIGKQNIEGLLPKRILASVYAENPDLVQLATSNTSEKKSAQGKLKKKLLEEFKKNQEFTPEYFGEFYALTKKINKIF